MKTNNEVHHCFNCGEESENYKVYPNGKKIWFCDLDKCSIVLNSLLKIMKFQAIQKAEEDNYREYY